MARDGSGTYSNPYPDFVAGTVISSAEVDANNSDIATALTQSIAVDGQTTVTANLPMATYKFTGLGAGSAATDSANLGQVQAGSYIWCGTMAGGADAGTLSPAPAITAYAAGQRFAWKASTSANTGAMTVAISGLTTIAVQNDRAALAAGDHAASDIYMGILDTASTIQIMKVAGVAGAVLGPTSATDNAVARFDTTTGKLIQNSGVLITDANEVTATGFTGTLDGVLGGGTPAAASITTLTLTNDLTVANGGTGASTFTANNVLLGNGTSAFQVIAPGSDGQVLTSTGSTWQSEALASVLSLEFESAAQTITQAGLVTTAHSLGVAPKLVLIEQEFQAAIAGWTIGDRQWVPGAMGNSAGGANANGSSVMQHVVYADATNVYIRTANITNFRVINKSTGNDTAAAWSQIKFIVRAFA